MTREDPSSSNPTSSSAASPPTTPSPSTSHPPTRGRGFIILIVLAVIATASVVLATQLAAVEGQQGAKLRVNEEAKARDAAEYCLGFADAYAVSFANANADFDRLLDPDGTPGNSDDFLPPAGLLSGATSVISVPPGRSGTMFQYRAFNLGAPTAAGATNATCLVRFDDNTDDINSLFTDTTTSNNTVKEGPDAGLGANITTRDRDRTIIITAIGLVPTPTNQADAYLKAHAHVTVKRVRSLPIGQNLGAAIEAGGTVDFDGSICGDVAGVNADIVKGGVCVCGVMNAQLVSGSQGSSAGDCGCPTCPPNTGSNTGAGARTDPVVTVPPFTSLLTNSAFGKLDTSTNAFSGANNIAAATYPAAVVYFQNVSATVTDAFVWDKFDTDTNAWLNSAFDIIITGGTKNCTDTSALDPLPDPCTWDVPGKTINCTAAQSQCWKLVAHMDTAAAGAVDADIHTAANITSHSNAAGTGLVFKTLNLPNVRNSGANTARWQDFSGGCTTCTNAAAFITRSGNNYSVAGGNAVADVPNIIAVINTAAAGTVTVGGLSRTGAKVAVFTSGKVSVAGSNQCCPQCTCTSACSSTANSADGLGLAIRTNQDCSDSSSYSIIGQVMCANIDLGNSNGTCITGGFIGLNKPGDIDCTLPGTPNTGFCSTAGFCVKNNMQIVGSILAAGSICLKNNLDMGGGSIQSQSSVGWKNNPAATAQIRAQGDIVGKNNATITFNGNTGAKENQGVPSAYWMESAW